MAKGTAYDKLTKEDELSIMEWNINMQPMTFHEFNKHVNESTKKEMAEKGLYLKTDLDKKHDKRLLPGAEVKEVGILFVDKKYGYYNFYSIEDTKDIKRRTKKVEVIEEEETIIDKNSYENLEAPEQTEDVHVTDENICKALYIVNKEAKKMRDLKNNEYKENYNYRDESLPEYSRQIVDRYKTEEIRLYDLKNYVIRKAIQDNILTLVGYHTQTKYGYKKYLLLYKSEYGYTFHMPIIIKPDCELLGDIPVIPGDKNDNGMSYYESIKLLRKYLKK